MKNRNSTSMILKMLGLLILDIITVLLVFSVWSLIDLPIFLLSIIAIFFSLILLNAAILSYDRAIERFGVGATVSCVATIIFYYLFVMVFTRFAYLTITPKWYTIIILVASLILLMIIAGLYFSGMNKAFDTYKQKMEQKKVLDITLQNINIEQCIKGYKGRIEGSAYQSLVKAFDDMYERIKASTPFGRSTREIVIQMEEQISEKLSKIYEDLDLIKDTEGSTELAASVSKSMSDVKNLVINREKMMAQ